MAQLEQPSASANAKTPIDSAPERVTAHPVRTGVLPVIGVLAAVAIAAGALVYYQGEYDVGTGATAPQASTSDIMASAPVETTPLTAQGTPSPAQSATTVPKASTDESGARATANTSPSVQANSARPRHLAKASKPARALQPRERQVVLATRPQPAYPVQALRAGEQGTVLVLAQVNVDGQVTDARVVGHSGSRILDRAAPNEVRHWKFEPALHAGRPVVASVEVPVSYRLNQ